jgi:hypothetical protein
VHSPENKKSLSRERLFLSVLYKTILPFRAKFYCPDPNAFTAAVSAGGAGFAMKKS